MRNNNYGGTREMKRMIKKSKFIVLLTICFYYEFIRFYLNCIIQIERNIL